MTTITTTTTTTTTTSPSSTNPLPLQDAASNPSSASQSSAEDYNAQIDALLTRYLHLLDEYTTLRSSLSSLQAGMYQSLARANFAAERGVRYGKEYFDERMVASRRVRVGGAGKGDKEDERGGGGEDEEKAMVEFRVVKVDEEGNEVVVKEKEEEVDVDVDVDVNAKKQNNKNAKEGETGKKEETDAEEVVVGKEAEEDVTQRADTTTTTSPDKASGTPSNPNDDSDTPEDKANKIKKIRNDPLRWFGLLTPLPLRQAQTQAIQAVEQIIPRLVTVNAEMAQVEIEVRRARKRREKAAVKAKAC
ncbi:hypothetical protein B0H65DRAFT_251289 [Neurospora tetraspora]|uniref:Vacuolar ATPase assembly protein VMA22 n=1 Tax=Neurospora tetraspora TaxID=94610 RepID=A0AAE0MP53_9PEZI|nr:hypothetical protein B0H65DRAFT_251289 [Neurospora tetraspora]